MKFNLAITAVFFWLAAFIFSFAWISKFESPCVMLAIAALFVAMALNDSVGIKKREWKFPVSPVLMVGSLFWLTTAISVVTSQILFTSWIYFFSFTVLPLTIVFFLVGDDFESRINQAWQGIKIVLGLLSLYAIYQYFFMPDFLFKGRVHEPLADANSLAAILSLGIFMLSGSLLKKQQKFPVIDGLIFFLMIAAFFTTGSRTAFLMMALFMPIMIVWIGIKNIGQKNWLLLGGGTVAALVLIGLIYTPTFYSGPLKVIQYTFGQNIRDILGERGLIWAASLDIIKTHLLFGTGIGTFSLYYPEVKNSFDHTAGFMAHNDPLQFAVEMGILAPIFFYMVCFLALVRTMRALKKLPSGDERRLAVIAPLFALSALVLHSHLTFNFHVMPCLMLVGFVFSGWYWATSKALQEDLRTVSAPHFMNEAMLRISFISVAVLMMVIALSPIYSQMLAAQASRDLEAGDMQGFARKIDEANEWALGQNPDALMLAANIPVTILKETKVTDKNEFINQAHELLMKAEKLNPRSAEVFMMKGQLAVVENQKGNAEENFRQAVKLDPYKIAPRVALGSFLQDEGRLAEAVDVMQQGLDFQYSPKEAKNYMDYYLQTARMKAALRGRSHK